MRNIVDIAKGMIIDTHEPMLVKGFNGSIVWLKQMEDGQLVDRMLTCKEIAREITEYGLQTDKVRYVDDWDDIVNISPVCLLSHQFSDDDFIRFMDLKKWFIREP